MPNNIAYIVLFSWPLVAVVLFRMLPRAQAIIATIIGGYLLLPHGVGIDLPMLPPFDKTLIPGLSAAVLSLLIPDRPAMRSRRLQGRIPADRTDSEGGRAVSPDGLRGARAGQQAYSRGTRARVAVRSGDRTEKLFIFLLLVTPFLTVLRNASPYVVGFRALPGLQLYDAFSIALAALVAILPYLVGRRYLADPQKHVILLKYICLAAFLYSLPTLFEVRMSPQLSRWFYGFLAQDWQQTMRGGGFRPVVFLEHGLWLAIFLAMAILSGFALWRQKSVTSRERWLAAAVWLLATLVLCRSLGALAIAALFMPVVLFMSFRRQILVASAVSLVFLTYPILRGADLVPVNQITGLVEMVSPARAGSLAFRLKNEDILLAHANDKPLVGWGPWGRARVFDPHTGKDLSTTDGMWIIVVSESGWLGYVGYFGLLTAPIILLYRRRRSISPATASLGLVLAANLVDMILNATLTPVTWLIAGALMGSLRLSTSDAAASSAGRNAARSDRRTSPVRERAMQGSSAWRKRETTRL